MKKQTDIRDAQKPVRPDDNVIFGEEWSRVNMRKKILILSGSPRKGGNSDLLCDEFARGATESGHEVEKIRVAAKKIAPCSACYFCREHHGQCVHQDDMAEVLQKMIDADVLVLASPVYSTTSSPWRTRTPPPPLPRWRACAAMRTAWRARWRRA